MFKKTQEAYDRLAIIAKTAGEYSDVLCNDPHGLNAWRTCHVLQAYAHSVSNIFNMFCYHYDNYTDINDYLDDDTIENDIVDECLLATNKRFKSAKEEFIRAIRRYKCILDFYSDGNSNVINECYKLCNLIDEIVEFAEEL